MASRIGRSRLLIGFALLVAIGSSGCGRRPARATRLPVDVPESVGQRILIDPIHTYLGLTGRSVLACPAGYCVILHFPPEPVPVEDLTDVLEGDPGTDADDGEVYDDPDSPWCSALAAGPSRNTFNCCAFAVGDVAGLTPDDWIMPMLCGDTFDTLPMQVLLDSFYERLQALDGPGFHWRALEGDAHLRTDDVLCFVSTTGQHTCYSHVGRILRKGGRNWLISKFGAGPILRTTIQAAGYKFAGQYDKIWIFRQKDQ